MNSINKLLKQYKEMSAAVKASLWFTISSILQKGVSFITVPIFTRLLTPNEYGIYSLFGSWQSILSIFATLNLSYQVFNNGMTKYDKDKEGYTTAMLGLSNLATIILFIIYYIMRGKINELLGLDTKYIILMFIGFFFSAATSLWTVYQRYLFKYKALCLVSIISSVGSALLGIIFVKYKPTGEMRIIASTLIITIVGGVIYIVIIKKNHKLINFEYWKYALLLTLPLIAHYLSMSILSSSDRIMINSMCGSQYLAFYSVPYNASMLMQIVISSINASFIPWTYKTCKNSDWDKLKTNSTILIFCVGLLTLLPSLFAPELVWILGSSEYAQSVWVVPPVSCSVFFIFLYSLFLNIELFYEKSKNIMKASIFTSIINIILNYIFINKYGYISAAYTTLVCYIALSIMHYIFMKKVLLEKNIKEKPYNIQIIGIISLIVVMYSILITVVYDYHFIIRYIIIGVILILSFIKREYIKNKILEFK